jgi:hypothetical protein
MEGLGRRVTKEDEWYRRGLRRSCNLGEVQKFGDGGWAGFSSSGWEQWCQDLPSISLC